MQKAHFYSCNKPQEIKACGASFVALDLSNSGGHKFFRPHFVTVGNVNSLLSDAYLCWFN